MATLICRVMGKVNAWGFDTVFQAQEEGTSATHIIDWENDDVWYPTIVENTWVGEWHKVHGDLKMGTIAIARKDGLN